MKQVRTTTQGESGPPHEWLLLKRDMMSNYKSKTTVYEKRADGSLFPLGQVVPNIDERVRKLENDPGAIVVAAPSIEGNLRLPIGRVSELTVSSSSLLVGVQISKFTFSVDDGEVQEVSASDNQAIISVEIPEGTLEDATFQLKVTAYDAYGSYNSKTVTLTAINIGVATPTISGKTTDVVKGEAAFSGSSFQMIGAEGNHDKSDWVLVKSNAPEVEVWSSKNDVSNKTNCPSTINDNLESGVQYILKLRYHDSTNDLWSEYGQLQFTTANVAVRTPTLSGETTDVIQGSATFTGSPFEIVGVSESNHDKSDWMLVRANAPDSKIWGSENDGINKITSPQGLNDVLEVSTTYIIKVRYHDAIADIWSDWGQLEFTTAAEFLQYNYIGEPGTYGFGVGVCDDANGLAALGLEPMEGTFNPRSDNYGNYQRTDGKGVWVFVPAFCYKFEANEKSPSHFVVKSFKDFDFNETTANEQGYILHQAFIDGGVAQKGFFIAKYLMSKGVKSVKNGITLSLDSSDSSNASSQAEGNGASGMAHDAMTLSKTLGQQYNCASVYMYSAIAMLAYIHGIYATSTGVCAWYDPEGTTNYPKGCNNNALGDCDDGEILYQNGDSKLLQKPNTGSANHFARTTHNGQTCGICDVNGCIEQVVIGAILQYTNLYVAPASAQFTAYTKDNANSTDSSLYVNAVNLDNKSYKWGNATQNCLYTGQSGTNRALCGVWPNNPNSSGTNEFGNDQAHLYHLSGSTRYGLVRCAGSWSSAQSAGVWSRDMISDNSRFNSWTSSRETWGFRSGAYLPET